MVCTPSSAGEQRGGASEWDEMTVEPEKGPQHGEDAGGRRLLGSSKEGHVLTFPEATRLTKEKPMGCQFKILYPYRPGARP